MDNDILLNKISRMYGESASMRLQYEDRWVKNMKLLKGIPIQDKSTVSKVTNRNKIYFRKIWAISWRLVAALYSAILRDEDNFKIEGRDLMNDVARAEFLQLMTKYRIDQLRRTDSLFLKHIWALKNIVDMGWCVGKFSWNYKPELDIDNPSYTLYPPEQVYPDFNAETKDKMKYIIFENYISKEEMEEMGYENINDAIPERLPISQLKATRFANTGIDPSRYYGENEYPEPGTVAEEQDSINFNLYKVWEVFYKQKGKIMLCITNGRNRIIFKQPEESKYGKYYPVVMGLCLSEAHKLIGEGLPEPLEGPQESYNYIINMRQENVALALNKPTIVSRYGNVDLNALTNRGAGKVVLADEINSVQELRIDDVTQSAYKETQMDIAMMDDVSGVVAAIQGLEKSDTATQAQINFSQGTAKIDLYTAIVAETYYKDFITTLAYMIQRFETDETVFRITNQAFSFKNGFMLANPYNLDFDADIRINVGPNIGREQEIRQALLVLDRGTVYNQSMMQLLQLGAAPPEGLTLFNGAQIFKDLLPKLGQKEIDKYFVVIGQPPVQQGAVNNQTANAMTGLSQPQIGNMADRMPQNDLQAGGQGGY